MSPDLEIRKKARQNLRAQGITIAQFARENNYPVVEVYRVLDGKYKGFYGRAYQIAIDLGIVEHKRQKAA